ncbi:MAG: hypothetical protein WAZ27_00590 [Minisyncoccia bacterium]
MTSRLVSPALFFAILLGSLVCTAPAVSSAQQLRLTEGTQTTIEDVHTYRAYYGKLVGEEHTYAFSTAEENTVNFLVLVPDIAGAKTDIGISLFQKSDAARPLSNADGALMEWTQFFDTAGRDSYLAGPSLQATLPQGDYEVRITNPENSGSYVLIVGSKASFSIAETLRRYATLPNIKSDFFQKSAIEAYVTPLLLWPIFGSLIVVGFALFSLIVYRRRLRLVPDPSTHA